MKKSKTLYCILAIFILLITFNVTTYAKEPKIDSGSALLIETNTGRVLYDKNADKIKYPASTTKILTAILVLEKCKLDEIATVSNSALESIPTGYVTCNLQPGEELKIEDLLYALMVKSANDAAVVLAEHIAGSVDNFSEMMNSKAKELGCENTHFVNPNGIHSKDHYTTAHDLYLMANYAMKNEMFRKLVSSTSYTLPATNKYSNTDRTFTTTNELLIVNNNTRDDNYYYKHAIGIKTGYTKQAGNCIVAGAVRDNLSFIAVILDGGTTDNGLSERYLDTIHLFDYAYDNFTLTKIKNENNVVKTIEIENATKETKNLDLLIKDSITVINNKETNTENLLPEITLNADLKAPITKGDTVGSIKYVVDDIAYNSDLLAASDVIQKPNYSTLILVIGLILLFLGIFITFFSKKNHRKKYKRRARRY